MIWISVINEFQVFLNGEIFYKEINPSFVIFAAILKASNKVSVVSIGQIHSIPYKFFFLKGMLSDYKCHESLVSDSFNINTESLKAQAFHVY